MCDVVENQDSGTSSYEYGVVCLCDLERECVCVFVFSVLCEGYQVS